MPEPQSGWLVLQCPNCDRISKCDPQQVADATCPSCGGLLDPDQPAIPDPNLILEEEAETEAEAEAQGGAAVEGSGGDDDDVIVHQPATAPSPDDLGSRLIMNIGAPEPEEPQLDTSRIKSTTDEDLSSPAEERIRIKRKSRRVEKELTSWEKGEGEDGEESEGRHRRRPQPTPKWLSRAKVAALAAVPTALVALTIYGVIASLKDKPVEERVIEPEVTPASRARESFSALEAGSLDREKSKQIYRDARVVAENFLKADSWEERLPFIREPERVGPLMKKHYADPDNPDGPIAHRQLPDEGKIIVHETKMLFMVESDDHTSRPLALEQISEDQYRVDWESFVGYCEVPWDEISTRKPTEPFVLRAKAKQRSYYNYGFQDDEWSSWQLEDRAGNYRLFGYVEREGPLRIELLEQTRLSKGPVYMLLKVRFPKDAPAGDQLEITEVICKGWVSPRID